MARCKWCKRQFTQIEARKMVTCHIQPDGTEALNIPTENKVVTGPVIWAAHYKEYKEHDKREKRGGNAVSGSSLGGLTPTAYDIGGGVDTQAITDRQILKRTIGAELGVDSENWRVAEVMRRRDHGDHAYAHTHERRMELFKVQFHLAQAHGIADSGATMAEAQKAHELEHVQMAKQADPGYVDYDTTDWHDSIEVDL